LQHKGFTLIELVFVILILGILAAASFSKFVNLQDDAQDSVLLSIQGAIASAATFAALKIQVQPENLSVNENRFILDNGDSIRVRGKLADGRWNITFANLLNVSDIEQVTSNDCDDDSLRLCVRQRGAGWFFNRGYSTLETGRGFVVFPFGYNLNQDNCYVYYINPNDTAIPSTVEASIIGNDFSEC